MSGAGEGRHPASAEARLADRAARLARLSAAGDAPGSGDRALASVLRRLQIDAEPGADDVPEMTERAAVVPFQRGSRAPFVRSGDLDRLPGIGPGLIWALERAGIRNFADLAATSPEALARQLGPIGGLIDLDVWIDCARRAGRDGTPARPD